jgi:peroxidase
MATSKLKGLGQFGRNGHNDDGSDSSDLRGIFNTFFNQHGGFASFPPIGPFHGSHGGSGGSSGPSLLFRSIDGSGNNLAHPDWNKANTDFARATPAEFAGDDGHTMVGGPNPRDISNIVVAGHGDDANPQGLSGMMYAWGQFVDHDLDLEAVTGTAGDATIHLSGPDPDLPGVTEIPLSRADIDPATGTAAKPGAAINTITGWMDASQVYGSDQATADSLRLADGHMKTSAGDLLPVVQAPNPADPSQMVNMFAAGDARAQENPDLTALQTLFVREHNYQVDLAHQKHPNWTGDQLYQYAKAVVTAEIEHITYDEFLPHLLGAGAITPYHGYNPNVDPRITEEFAGAAFRLGHSLVSAEIDGINNQGADTSTQSLKDVFFETADAFAANGGADGLLRHLTADLSNKLDVHIVDDLRNFLFAPPDAMDLAAINIQRGRDLGIESFNDVRAALGLAKYTSFDQITHDAATVAALKQAYNNDIDSVDTWTGGLAEDPVNGGMVGQTFSRIIAMQFEDLRDGDRFWYQNQGFDQQTLATINNTTLSDVIMRNTDTDFMQPDAFVYYDRHGGTKSGMDVENPNSPQFVVGSKGFDTLIGGQLGDYLVAATGGTQSMTGGAGADTFVVNHADNVVITDFKPGTDKILFNDAGSLAFKDIHIKADHGNAVIDANTNHIVLLNVVPFQLHPQDFLYHA